MIGSHIYLSSFYYFNCLETVLDIFVKPYLIYKTNLYHRLCIKDQDNLLITEVDF